MKTLKFILWIILTHVIIFALFATSFKGSLIRNTSKNCETLFLCTEMKIKQMRRKLNLLKQQEMKCRLE